MRGWMPREKDLILLVASPVASIEEMTSPLIGKHERIANEAVRNSAGKLLLNVG